MKHKFKLCLQLVVHYFLLGGFGLDDWVRGLAGGWFDGKVNVEEIGKVSN